MVDLLTNTFLSSLFLVSFVLEATVVVPKVNLLLLLCTEVISPRFVDKVVLANNEDVEAFVVDSALDGMSVWFLFVSVEKWEPLKAIVFISLVL